MNKPITAAGWTKDFDQPGSNWFEAGPETIGFVAKCDLFFLWGITVLSDCPKGFEMVWESCHA